MFLAAISVFLEKQSHISSGGVSGLCIGISDIMHLNVGLVNLWIKGVIFTIILIFGGRSIALWTMVGAVLTGLCMWLFEMIPLYITWPKWLAFGLILLFSKFPIGLLVSKGYSTGGYTAIGQVLCRRLRIPLRISLSMLNTISILAMFVSNGAKSGALTALIALTSGFATEAWATIARKWLDSSPLDHPKIENHLKFPSQIAKMFRLKLENHEN
nr:YitT family protein [Ferroacidibacillus organovorans]